MGQEAEESRENPEHQPLWWFLWEGWAGQSEQSDWLVGTGSHGSEVEAVPSCLAPGVRRLE